MMGNTIVQKVQDSAKLTPQEFKLESRQIAQTLNIAAEYGMDLPPETVRQLSNRLMELNPDQAPIILAALVNFKSARSLKRADLLDPITRLKTPCVENPPAVVSGAPPTKIEGQLYRLNLKEFHDCVQILDGTFWDNVKFRRCLLVYRGGPVGWGIIGFDESLFKIALPEHPTDRFHEFTQTLVAKDFPNFELKPSEFH